MLNSLVNSLCKRRNLELESINRYQNQRIHELEQLSIKNRNEIDSIEQRRGNLEKINNEKDQKIKELDQLNKNYQNQLSETKKANEILNQANKGCNTKIGEVDQANILYKQRVSELESRITLLEQTNTERNKKIKEIDQSNNDRQKKISDLEKMKKDLEQTNTAYHKKMQELEQINKLNQHQFSELELRNQKLEKTSVEDNKRIKEMEHQQRFTELNKANNDLKQNNIDSRNKIQEMEQRIEDELIKSERDFEQIKIANINRIQEMEQRRMDEIALSEKDHRQEIERVEQYRAKEMEQRIADAVARLETDHQQEIERLEQCKIIEMEQKIADELARAETDHQQEMKKVEQNRLNDLEQSEQKIFELQRSLEELKIKYPNVEETNKRLQEELDTMRIYLDTIKNKDTEPIKANVIEYDCILNVENFSDISTQGWVLKLPPQEDDFKQKKCGSVFALVGLYNKGKTFILNQLTGSLFGSGQSYTTKGISMKEVTIDKDKFFVLDTAGTNSPIDLTKIQERDKKITEVFIQDLALSIADYFILVVNDFTSKDQKILRRIVQYAKEQRQSKSIFVIHNFKDVKEQALHQYVWEEQVIKIFAPVQGNGEINTSVHVTLDDGRSEERIIPYYKGEHTTHYSLVNNSSKYGAEFNKSSIQLIKETIKRQITHANTSTLYSTLLEKITVSLSNADINISSEENSERITCTAIENWATIVPRRGLKFLQQNEFEPTFDIFEANDHYYIILDVPGMSLDDIEILWVGDLTTISGNREKDHQENTSGTNRRFGKFSLDFHIPLGFKPEPECEPQLVGGILKLEYAKQVAKGFKGKNVGK